MSYQVFARKYRPQTFDQIVGQEHITQTLRNAIEQKRLAHAYLFVGPRGTGKTSTARILAKALNCVNGPTTTPCGVCDACKEISAGNSLDVLEIDGASNNGVEQVRELRDNVRFAPTRGKYKIYIIDEVHMLSPQAFNALLKTLEEPPEHVKFVFATTEPQKVLPTILSRCQRFDLSRIPTALISKHLLYIATQENIALEENAAQAIAKGAEGGLRDAESMLDQLVAFCGDKIAEADVLSIFGFTAQQTMSSLCDFILAGSSAQALGLIHDQAQTGKDLSRLMADLISYLRDLLIAKADPEAVREELSADSVSMLGTQAEKISMERLLEIIEQFAAAEGRMKWAPNKKLHFEIALIKAIQTLNQATLTEVVETLAALRGGSEPPTLQRPIASTPKAVNPPVKVAEKIAPKPESPAPESPTVKEEPAKQQPVQQAEPVPVKSPEIVQPETAPAVVDQDQIWGLLLEQVRTKRSLIISWLEKGTLLQLGQETCLIGFPPECFLAQESIMRPNTRVFLEAELSTLAGRPIKIKTEAKQGLLAPQVAPPPEPLDPMAEFKNDPLIKKALELFKGEIQTN